MNVFATFLLYILLSLTYQEYEARRKARSRKVVNYVFFEDCEMGRYPNVVNYSKLVYNGHIKTMDVDTYFAHEYDHLLGRFTAHKCTTMRDKACEPLITGQVDMCKVFTDKDQFYSYSFQECLRPKLRCPVKKGIYRLRNASLGVDELLAMVPFKLNEYFVYYYNIKARIYDPIKPKETVLCINMMFKVDIVKD